MKLKSILLAASASMVFASAASANEGLYGAIGAGLSYMQPDQDFEIPNSWDSDIDYDNGIGVYTALGYAYANGLRGELEFSYRDNDARHIPGDNAGFSGWPDGVDGGIRAYTVMANLIKDFDTESPLTPFLGIGLGGARLKADYRASNPVALGGPSTLVVDDSTTRLAAQGIAGLSYALAEGLDFDLSYRYLITLKPDFDSFYNGSPTDIKQAYSNHSLFAGLRWSFGGAAPAIEYKDCWDGSTVTVDSDCPPELVERQSLDLDPVELIVYFDYDKSNLTPEASNLISTAAQSALANDIDTVVVSGNTDSSGSSAYNQTLSERRARVVRDALIANGIPADSIETQAFGESNPAKPTPDGTREPLNRRSEVVISFE